MFKLFNSEFYIGTGTGLTSAIVLSPAALVDQVVRTGIVCFNTVLAVALTVIVKEYLDRLKAKKKGIFKENDK